MLKPVATAAASPLLKPLDGSAGATPCFYTDYDGVGDYFNSSDASLKISGSQTWAFELWMNSAASLTVIGFMGNRVTNTGGFSIVKDHVASVDRLLCYGSGGSGQTQLRRNLTAGDFDGWHNVVAVRTGTSIAAYYDGVVFPITDFTNPIGDPTIDFHIGRDPGFGWNHNGRLRNIEIYSGAASNPTAWVPGNTSSMSGVTLVMQSEDGGTNNNQSISFTTNGDPQRVAC